MTIINQIISYKLSGISYSGSSTQLNYTAGVTPGICIASKALVVDQFSSINSINAITAATLTVNTINGTISSSSASQTNITTLGTLTGLSLNNNINILQHDGSTKGLMLAGVLVTSSGAQLNYNNITTPGVAQVSRTLVLDSFGSISGINSLSTTTLVAANITLGSTALTVNGTQINYNNITTPGIAQVSRTLVLNSSGNISSINTLSATTLSATTLTGTISTASQPNITSLGALTGLTVNGAVSGITNITISGTLSGGTGVSATNLTGTIQTSSQPNITSLGTLSSLTVSGNFTADTTTTTNLVVAGNDITSALGNVSVLSGVTQGQATASKVLIVNASRNITNINSLTATSLVATNLTGSIQTAAQPNITSLGALTGLTFASSSSISNLTNLALTGTITGASSISATSLSGTLTSPNQTNITSVGTLSNLFVSGAIGIATSIPSRQLEINSSSGSCLRLSYNAPTGSATNYSDFLMDASNNLIINTNGGNINLLSDIIIGNSTSPNQLMFAQMTGNNGGTFITERFYNSTFTELLLFNGNNIAGSNGPDRIRLRSGEMRFQIYPTTESYSSFNDSNNAMIINSTGRISMNCSSPTNQLDINSATGECLRLIYNSSSGSPSNFADLDVNFQGALNIKSSSNYVQIGDSSDNSQSLLLGTSASGGITGTILLSTSTTLNTLQSGVGNISGSSQDFAIIDYGMTIQNSNRKIMFKSNGSVGIGTFVPSTRLEINDVNGNCLRLSFNSPSGNATQYCTQSISSSGVMTFNVIGTAPSFAFTSINNQLANVAAIISTPSQPNITSLGALTGLNISGNISSVTNIVMSGSLTGATSVGSTFTNLIGLISTANQTNITGLGTLNNLSVNNKIQVGTTNNPSASDLLYASGNANSYIGLRLENLNPTASSSGSMISFTGFNSTNTNWEIGRIACLTTNSGSAASYQFGSLAFYVRNTNLSSTATEAMRLSNLGYLGINNNNPAYTLTVNGITSTSSLLVGTSTDTRSSILISALDNTIANNTNRFIAVGKSATNNNQFEISYNHISDGSTNFGQLGLYGSSFRLSVSPTGVGIGVSQPNRVFEINQSSAVYGLRLSNNSSSNSSLTDIGTDSVGNLYITSSNNSLYLGSSADSAQSLVIGSTNSTATTGVLNIFTTASGNFIQSSVNPTTGSSQDLYICDYIASTQGTMPNILLTSRKIVFKSSGAMGLGNVAPSRQLEINHSTGSCLRLSYGGTPNIATTNNFCDQTISANGLVVFNAVGSGAGFQFVNGGSSVATISATLVTNAQPNITSVGALTSLAFANNGSITNLSNITMSGVITGATSVGTLSSPTSFFGTLQTAAQPNITSIGGLSSLSLTGAITGGVTGITFGNNVSLSLPASGVGNSSSITATYLTGQIQTAAQPSITSVGALTNLNFANGGGINNISSISFASGSPSLALGSQGSISAGSIIGTIQTAAQPNITSVGTLTSLQITGGTGITYDSNSTTTAMIFSAGSTLRMPGNSTIFANALDLGQTALSSNGTTINGTVISASATGVTWGLNGIQFNSSATAYRDNSGNAVITDLTFNSFGRPVLSSSRVAGTTTTNASTVYIAGGPIASDNQTITNSYGLIVNGATSLGRLDFGNNAQNMTIGLFGKQYGFGACNNCVQYFSGGNQGHKWYNTSVDITGSGSASGTNTMTLSNSGDLSIAGSLTVNSGTSTFNNGYTNFTGNVGIGQSSNFSYGLYINNNGGTVSSRQYTVITGSVTGQIITAAASSISLYTTGRIYCNSELNVASDRRMKNSIIKLDGDFCENFVRLTNPVQYYYNHDSKTLQYGYIAQEILNKGFGSALVSIIENEDMKNSIDEETGLNNPEGLQFTMAYDKIVPVLGGALKVSYEKIDNLTNIVNDLQNENKLLKEQLNNMQESINLLLQRL